MGNGCTHGHCERRIAYLRAVTTLLLDDLQAMVQQWAPDVTNNYRAQLVTENGITGMARILEGMAHLSLGELAGERMQAALEANSPEDEQDCFSDNTHASLYYNGLGIQNVYLGRYQRIDGSVLTGPSLAQWVQARQPKIDHDLRLAFNQTQQALQRLMDRAEATGPFQGQAVMRFDQMIAPGNQEGAKLIKQAIEDLMVQTQLIDQIKI